MASLSPHCNPTAITDPPRWSSFNARTAPIAAIGRPAITRLQSRIMARPLGFPNGILQGYTYGRPANIGVITDQDAAATVAHEIGHTYGLGDTYDGGSFNCPVNPAPAEFQGQDWIERSKTVTCGGQ